MVSWSEEEFRAFQRERGQQAFAEAKAAKPSKYRNVKTVVNGVTFDSKREASIWHELKLREKAGEIHDLKRQVQFSLFAPVISNSEVWKEVSKYVGDFVYKDMHGKEHIVDVKGGKETAMFALKRKWLFLQSGIEIEVIR